MVDPGEGSQGDTQSPKKIGAQTIFNRHYNFFNIGTQTQPPVIPYSLPSCSRFSFSHLCWFRSDKEEKKGGALALLSAPLSFSSVSLLIDC